MEGVNLVTGYRITDEPNPSVYVCRIELAPRVLDDDRDLVAMLLEDR